MSLQAILEAIRESGRAQVREIEGDAHLRAQEILARARLEADNIKEAARLAAIAPAAKQRARIIHRARLERLRIVGKVRENLVDTALEQTCGRLAATRTDTAYPLILRRLTEEALSELAGALQLVGKARLEADRRDRALMAEILQDLELDVTVSYSLHCLGGVIAKSEDGRLVVINTLEARLERATPYLRRYLAAFFESEQPEEVVGPAFELSGG